MRKKNSPSGQSIESDNRGKHTNKPKKLSDDVLNSVREHINLFERVESHYCRSSSSREYLDETLNISKMYAMYEEFMSDKNITPIASEHKYRDIFNHEFNLSFHKPKKDQCDACASFKFLSDAEKQLPKFLDVYDEHIKNKNLSRQMMQTDKEEAKSDDSILCASFDLQKVLPTPRSQISQMYYKRKLSIYNFTVFDMVSKLGQCNIWNETTAKRGGNEISSCLWKFIVDNVQKEKDEFRFYSDNCGGQNKNQILFTMYIKAASNYQVTVTQRYKES